MTRAFAALLCLGALAAAVPAFADEAEEKAALAAQIIEKMPFWATSGEEDVREFLDARVFPFMQRRGVKKAMAAALAQEMTVKELAAYKTMLENVTYRSVLVKLGRANAMMQGILGAEMTIGIRCVPVAERPEALRKAGEFNAAEHEYFCRQSSGSTQAPLQKP